ncbi:MAG: peptidylprolyl isomerase, partial [Proteobacteria bacterium]|nr:peptidylprolyl isomerase [Pseudomonadota bacterium]
NFLRYVAKAQYNNTIFHRLVPGFVIQGGGYDAEFSDKPSYETIVNESGNGLSNQPGTIAMARTNLPHTATAQFFINVSDNLKLDPKPSRWGYTVFGTVVEGMDIVEAIAAIPTGPGGPFPTDVPQSMVIIEKASVMLQRATIRE